MEEEATLETELMVTTTDPAEEEVGQEPAATTVTVVVVQYGPTGLIGEPEQYCANSTFPHSAGSDSLPDC